MSKSSVPSGTAVEDGKLGLVDEVVPVDEEIPVEGCDAELGTEDIDSDAVAPELELKTEAVEPLRIEDGIEGGIEGEIERVIEGGIGGGIEGGIEGEIEGGIEGGIDLLHQETQQRVEPPY